MRSIGVEKSTNVYLISQRQEFGKGIVDFVGYYLSGNSGFAFGEREIQRYYRKN